MSKDVAAHCKVTEVINGNTIRIFPGWVFRDHEGDLVRINGYTSPKAGALDAQEVEARLSDLVLGSWIEVKNITKFIRSKSGPSRLVTDVCLDNENAVGHLPDCEDT